MKMWKRQGEKLADITTAYSNYQAISRSIAKRYFSSAESWLSHCAPSPSATSAGQTMPPHTHGPCRAAKARDTAGPAESGKTLLSPSDAWSLEPLLALTVPLELWFCWNSGSWRLVPSETLGNKPGKLCSWGLLSAEDKSSQEKLTEMTLHCHGTEWRASFCLKEKERKISKEWTLYTYSTDLGCPVGTHLGCFVRHLGEHNDTWVQQLIYSTKIYPAPTLDQLLFYMLENQAWDTMTSILLGSIF